MLRKHGSIWPSIFLLGGFCLTATLATTLSAGRIEDARAQVEKDREQLRKDREQLRKDQEQLEHDRQHLEHLRHEHRMEERKGPPVGPATIAPAGNK